jgi:hypothetical protein
MLNQIFKVDNSQEKQQNLNKQKRTVREVFLLDKSRIQINVIAYNSNLLYNKNN